MASERQLSAQIDHVLNVMGVTADVIRETLAKELLLADLADPELAQLKRAASISSGKLMAALYMHDGVEPDPERLRNNKPMARAYQATLVRFCKDGKHHFN